MFYCNIYISNFAFSAFNRRERGIIKFTLLRVNIKTLVNQESILRPLNITRIYLVMHVFGLHNLSFVN